MGRRSAALRPSANNCLAVISRLRPQAKHRSHRPQGPQAKSNMAVYNLRARTATRLPSLAPGRKSSRQSCPVHESRQGKLAKTRRISSLVSMGAFPEHFISPAQIVAVTLRWVNTYSIQRYCTVPILMSRVSTPLKEDTTQAFALMELVVLNFKIKIKIENRNNGR